VDISLGEHHPIYNLPNYKFHHDQVVFYLSGVDISLGEHHPIYNLPKYKFDHDQVVFYLSDVDITWRTSSNIYIIYPSTNPTMIK
jgi:hypothetical protein